MMRVGFFPVEPPKVENISDCGLWIGDVAMFLLFRRYAKHMNSYLNFA
jgi:hypothetical protein